MRAATRRMRSLSMSPTSLLRAPPWRGPNRSTCSINNAGTNRPKMLPDVTVEDFDVIMGLNVRAAFFMAQTVALRLIEAKRPGSIINISSQMGHVGAARRTVYCTSKHAMEGFTKAMAIELAPHNIRVNSLGPTFLETPMTRPFFENKAFRDEVLGKIKLGRLGQLDELTGAIVFLASDASSLMTGSALVLDGGWTAEWQTHGHPVHLHAAFIAAV